MDIIEKFLSGEIGIGVFMEMYRETISLREQLDALVPHEAMDNPEHPFWNNQLYYALSQHKYKITSLIDDVVCFNDSIGDNYNMFETIKSVFEYVKPDFCFTTVYSDMFDLYMNAIGECYEGSEVKDLIEQIVHNCISIQPKTKRIKETRQQISQLFHTTDGKRPNWIQGPDWPMGKNSPMKYIERKRKGERVDYSFEDVDTGEKRLIIQYY